LTETIQLDRKDFTAFLGYTSRGLTIDPEELRVGQQATITLHLQNIGDGPIAIRKIEPKVAEYGIGVSWSDLPTIEDQIYLPADPVKIQTVTIPWTPTRSGNRCFRAFLHTSYCIHQAICIGRNLQILEAAAEENQWRIPFKLGNPKGTRLPVYPVLRGVSREVTADILIQETRVESGQTIWLNPGQEVNGVVFLKAQTDDAIKTAVRVEAVIGFDRQFLDGLEIEVARPAYCLTKDIEQILVA